MNKFFTKKNILLFILSSIFIIISYVLNYKIEDYILSVFAPIFMILGYLPFALMEMNIRNSIENKTIKSVLTAHVIITSVMIIIYFIAILIYTVTIK